VGARRQHKGFDLFVEAAAILVNSGGLWDKAHFVMVGDKSPWEPEFEARLSELEKDSRLAGRLHALPAQSRPASWLKTFKLVVCPSRREGFGLVALESMVLGTPVVAAYPEAAEYMKDGSEGVLAPSGDAPALALAMRRAMQSPMATKRRAARAKKRARQEFTPQVYMAALDYHYLTTLNNRP
jgi:glycosyltransferase involved in cell wall biosynthesis